MILSVARVYAHTLLMVHVIVCVCVICICVHKCVYIRLCIYRYIHDIDRHTRHNTRHIYDIVYDIHIIMKYTYVRMYKVRACVRASAHTISTAHITFVHRHLPSPVIYDTSPSRKNLSVEVPDDRAIRSGRQARSIDRQIYK